MQGIKFFTTKIGVAIIAAIALGAVSYGWLSREPLPSIVSVTRGDVSDEVIVTGNTRPVESIDLAFARGGRIARVSASVGAKVSAGDILAELDIAELSAQLKEARASVASAQAKLDALTRGARPEDIQITQTKVSKAEQDLANNYNSVLATLADAYAKADDAVRNQVSSFFLNADLPNVLLTFSTNNSQIQTDVQSNRFLAGTKLNVWKNELLALQDGTNTEAALDNALVNTQAHLSLVLTFLNRAMDAVTNSVTLSSATITTYKTSITTARNGVTTAVTNVNSASQAIASQKIVVQQYKDELALLLAGTTEEDIRAQQAAVDQTAASVTVIEAQLAQTVLRSPITGTVTKQEAKIGTIAQAGQSLISIISADNLEIISNIPEVDIGKIELNDTVAITFDAFQGETFSGKVVEIEPAETIVDGVVNFKITTVLDIPNPRLKSGLTANLEIETEKKTGVLIVPAVAVIQNDEGTFVDRYENGTVTKVAITLGIRDQSGNVEIISGVSEGDKVVNVGLKAQ